MKILVLNYEYPPVGGGGGRLSEKLSEAFVARGHEVRVLTAGVGALAPEEIRGGVQIIRPRSFRKRQDTCTVPEMGLYLVTALPRGLREALSWKPDVAHAHFVVPTGLLALGLHRLAGVPYVITAHLGDVPGGVPEQTGGLFRLASPLAKAVWRAASERTAVSNFVGDLAKKAFGISPRVILNGIPPLAEAAIDVQRGSPLKLLMVGRLSVQKNPLLAVRALSRIRGKAWTLDVVGEGPLLGAMQAEVRQLNLGEKITFSGWLPEDEVRSRMRRAEVLLMTSLHEGLPMVAVEALWHGLAIIGSRIGGLADVIAEGENGFLCDLEPGSFAVALQALLEDPALLQAMREHSLQLAKQFDFNASVEAYERCLSRASATPSP